MSPEVFVQQLRSVMTDNKFSRMIGSRLNGELDQRKMWRASTGAKNVFRQEAARKGKEYSVVLLLDESGSMGGNKYDVARETTIEMAKALARAGVDTAIIGFNCRLLVHKKFGEKFDQAKLTEELREANTVRATNHSRGTHYYAGNHNYAALEAGYKMLSSKKYGKIMLHISDGHPTCDYPEDCKYDQKLHRKANLKALTSKHPEVLDIGVGIYDTSVLPDIHDEVIEIRGMSEFKPLLINVLKKHIRRG
jgi:cobalamin biosynthesis protein CobT